MSTLLTVAGLGSVTLIAMYRHLRRATSRAATNVRRPERVCPRCGAALTIGASDCPSCGAPLQVFELVSAPIAAGEPDDATAPPRAHIRSDLCVGCGACVASCPEPDALSMIGKLAVVNPTRCQGHGECVSACPLSAISIGRGNARNRVVVPKLDANFQTTVPGLYIVGELGGRALIKNAVNEGRVAAEHVVKLAILRRRETGDIDGIADVIIVGSGPSGLSAGLVAHRTGVDYLLLEQGTLAETVRRYPRHKVLFAEPLTMPLYGDLWVADASKENLLTIWEDVIARTGLRVETGQGVRRIVRERNHFTVSTTGQEYRARAVVLALGRRGTPRRLDVPGEELSSVFYDIAEMADFAGRRVLVVGGGDSAIESALGLANQDRTTVTLSYRGSEFTRLKDRNRARLQAATETGRVTVLLRSEVREIRSDAVTLDVDGDPQVIRCDDVVIRIGGEAPAALLDQLGVCMVTKELAPPTASGRVESGDAA